MDGWMGRIQRDAGELQVRAAQLEQRLSRLELTAEQEASAVRFAERARMGLAHLTYNERQELMRLLVEDVTCEREHAVVRTVIPLDDGKSDVSLCSPIQGGRVEESV